MIVGTGLSFYGPRRPDLEIGVGRLGSGDDRPSGVAVGVWIDTRDDFEGTGKC